MKSSKTICGSVISLLLIMFVLPVIAFSGCDKVPTFNELAGEEKKTSPAPPVPASVPVDRTPPKIERVVKAPPPKTPEMIYEEFLNMDQRLRSDKHIAQLAELEPEFRRQITELDLAGSNITDSGAEHFAEFPNLDTLIIDRTGISNGGMTYVGQLSGLVNLSMVGMRISTDGLKGIAGLTNLEYLDLSSTSINDLSFEHLLGMKNLQVLRIADIQQLQGQGLAELAKRGVLSNLRELVASNTHIGSDGLVALETMPHLEVLTLNNASISEIQLPHIANCGELVELYLNGSAIGNNSLKQLVKLGKLERLSLQGCSALTDDAFVFIKNMKSLTKLNVNNTRVTEAGVQKLKEQFLPDTAIMFKGREY